ncbi:MAG TPA: YetF domain-containing protein [Gaiellaceae bacterium]
MDIVLRAAFAYVFIVFLLRIVGRRELSSMEPSDLVLLVIMGDLVQNGITQSDYSVTGVVLAISTMGLLAVSTSWLVFRSKRAQLLIEGVPLILIEDGKPIEKNLRSERLTVGEVAEQARGQQIESLETVKWAVLESNGSISFIPK